MTTAEKKNRAETQAEATLSSIKEAITAYRNANETGGPVEYEGEMHTDDEIRDQINGEAYGIQVRSDWHAPHEKGEDVEYQIILAGGGPAVRIVGGLGRWNIPETARLEYQDWFTEWTELPCDSEDEEFLVEYAGMFYFGT